MLVVLCAMCVQICIPAGLPLRTDVLAVDDRQDHVDDDNGDDDTEERRRDSDDEPTAEAIGSVTRVERGRRVVDTDAVMRALWS